MFQLRPLEELVCGAGALVEGVLLEPGQGRPREGVAHCGNNTTVTVTHHTLSAIINLLVNVSLVSDNAT